ncbi:MAG: hypothetical protein KGS72_17865 [Cyanobacteria bacterium REEB67]|nr:hypothetical protein [Cyanobacteria bacterium REEB67]
MDNLLRPRDEKLFAISLPYRCPVQWDSMKGGDQIRHCSKCKQNVYNISLMSREAAVNLISENEGELCVRFYQRRDGSVITRDCASVLGLGKITSKTNILARINAYLTAWILMIIPMLAPAIVSVRQGGMEPMRPVGSQASGLSAEVTKVTITTTDRRDQNIFETFEESIRDCFKGLKKPPKE